MSGGELTARQRLFISEYLIDRNGTQAALRAGFAVKGASVQATRLLANVRVAAEIAKRTEKYEEKTGITAERVLAEIAKVAFSDTRRLYNDDGALKQPHEWDDETAGFVAGVEVTEEFEGRGDERELIGYTRKVKQWDKLAGLDKLAKHLGLFEKDNSQKVPNLQMQIIAVGPK